MKMPVLSPELLRKMDAYWRAANYVSVGQIYLYANPSLREPLTLDHVKPLVVGHWGTSTSTTSMSTARTCLRFSTGSGRRQADRVPPKVRRRTDVAARSRYFAKGNVVTLRARVPQEQQQ
jgi:hypothetical protein